MTNREIAQKINQISEMLEILNEDSFKVAAYSRAARMIDLSSVQLETVFRVEGVSGLEQVDGVGKSIAEKISELLETGQIKYYNQLLKKVPQPVLEFTRIPGVGSKTAVKLFDTFKVKNIKQLQAALKTDQHQQEFKPKTRAKILDGIEIYRQQGNRMLLSFAQPIADLVLKTLKKYPQVSKVDYVGSLRRRKETVGDIDIVVATKGQQLVASKQVIDKFCSEIFVTKVVNRGDTKARVINQDNVAIDLEILPSNVYGNLLQHFTGSKDHNIALRTYAEQHGFSISEHGVKKSKDKVIKCHTEDCVYGALNMDTPPPELRENRGEIEAALKHQLPKLIKLSDIKGDLQMHSVHSDGRNSIAQMAKACQAKGYKYMAITDHPATLGITHGLKESEINDYLREIKQVSKKVGIEIFSGIEANIKPNGDIDLPNKVLQKFDLVLGAIHTSFRQSRPIVTRRLIKAIANPYVKIIAHPSGRIINRRPGVDADWEQVFAACRKHQTIMEVNAYPDRLDLNDTLVRQAIDMGVKLIINTDSHSVDHLNNIQYGVTQARRGWATSSDIINTYSLAKFKTVLNIH